MLFCNQRKNSAVINLNLLIRDWAQFVHMSVLGPQLQLEIMSVLGPQLQLEIMSVLGPQLQLEIMSVLFGVSHMVAATIKGL